MTGGLPPWQPEMWRGSTSPRLRMKSNEALGALALLLTTETSPIVYRQDPLASGASTYAVDLWTGNPYTTTPVGYTSFQLGYGWSFNQLSRIRSKTDGNPDGEVYPNSNDAMWLEGSRPWYDIMDPFGASLHIRQQTFTNLGGADMVGLYNAPYIMKEVGTKRPEKKKVRCRVCGHQRNVNRRAAKVRCPKCKMQTLYMPMLFGEHEKPVLGVIK